ncbi:MAG TPA: tyrosine protein phosphatase [Dongiaceae bacterium]|nr:tyrosine protein phosphatase [Dongiaceae bacterium]
MFSSLTVTDLLGARKLKRRFDAVLTLQDPKLKRGELLRFARQPAPLHLRLRFDDIEAECDGAPQEAHVVQAFAFARTVQGNLLVHCHAGISRSGAMAYALMAEALGPGREAQALDELLAQRPIVVPNGRVVRIADRVMGRGGALIDVYRQRLSRDPRWQELKTQQCAYWMRMRPDLFPTPAAYERLRAGRDEAG